VEERFRGQKIILQHNFADFYGLESIGHFQAKGNGVQVMTKDELYFRKALPRREFSIPIDSITAVSNPRSHQGKTNISRLLRVEFSGGGSMDAIAWMVGDDVEVWTRGVEDARKLAA
jgi:hypothetical protein